MCAGGCINLSWLCVCAGRGGGAVTNLINQYVKRSGPFSSEDPLTSAKKCLHTPVCRGYCYVYYCSHGWPSSFGVFIALQKAFVELRFVLNAGKTKYIYVIFQNTLNVSDDFGTCTLDGAHIDRVPAYKYLGIWIDGKLSFKNHIYELVKNLRI